MKGHADTTVTEQVCFQLSNAGVAEEGEKMTEAP